MINLDIDITDIEDLKSSKNPFILGEIEKVSGEVLNAGGKVVITRSYTNAPDDRIREFSSRAEFDKWWQENITQ